MFNLFTKIKMFFLSRKRINKIFYEKNRKIIELKREFEKLNNNLQITKKEDDETISVLKEEQKKIEEENINLQVRVQEQTKQIDSLKQDNKDKQEKIDETEIAISKSKDKIEKQEKDIKSLEEHIDDLNNDLNFEKRKLNEKKEEIRKKEEENNILKDTVQKQTKQIKDKQEEIDEIEKDNNKKKESIDFVQDILLAISKKESDNNKTIHYKVKDMDKFIKKDLLLCLNKIIKDSNILEEDLFNASLNRWKIRRKKTWIKITNVAFIGEFSAGKTSIVNRLISQDNKNFIELPVSAKATTAIPTYILGSKNSTSFKFVTPKNDIKDIKETTFKKVNKDVLEQIKGISSLIKYFVMEYPNENLENITILDTPGFSSQDEEDTKRTIDVINECDALFWVFDVNNGTINKTSLNLIKNNLKKPLYIIVNKVDTKVGKEAEVARQENLIKDTFKKEKIKIEKIIKFSQKTELNEIMSIIKSIKCVENKDAYLGNVDNLISSYLDEFMKKIRALREEERRLNSNIESYNNKISKKIRGIEYTIDEIEDLIHFKKGFMIFSKDHYEMNKEEYNEIKKYLEQINQSIKYIDNKYKNQIKDAQEIKDTESKIFDYKQKYKLLENRYEMFNEKKDSIDRK